MAAPKETSREKAKREEYAAFLASRGRVPEATSPAPLRRASDGGGAVPLGLSGGGLRDERIHNCACGKFGMFGLGETWFCRAHLPANYWGNING